ncbi:MAG TPA: aminoglycoside 6-adenylyltransferase [Gaiellaceae bacterium]|nr:aminoglycoside 6-adenylyltransferase [Gaiellaceae bacterium]
MEAHVARFLDDVSRWAAEQPDVRAAVLLGSQARVDAPADPASDVDVALFVDDPAAYLDDAAWIGQFGAPLLSFREPTPVGGFEERRVLFRDGLEVDFTVVPAFVAAEIPPEADAVFARGFRVLYADGLDFPVRQPTRIETPPPTQAQFDQLVTDFWYHLLWAAKKLWRGEVLVAKQACDGWLTGRLVELARWRSREADTWHGFRFFERWAGDELVAALGPTFAGYEAADIGRALRAKAELFGQVEDEVAALHGLTVPEDRPEVLRRLEALL